MGTQLSFTEENIKKNPFDFPKVHLVKGEVARLTVMEDPFSEYVHTIQKPQLDDRGNVLMKTAERKNGTEYQTPKLTWVSSPICLGDRDVLDKDGIDPENCPVCARAAAGQKGFFPKRRFAMHVVRTFTKGKTFDPSTPFSGQLLIWAFADTVFNKLFSFNKEFGLKDHDLKLGPCTDEDFQKADLNVANDTAVSEEDRKAYFNDETKAEDPTVFCGARKTRARIEEDLAQVDAQWALSRGEADDSVASAASLSEGLGALLSDDEPKKAAKKSGKADGTDTEWVDDPDADEELLNLADLPEPEATKKPAAKKAAAKKPEPEEDDSIDDILDNL